MDHLKTDSHQSSDSSLRLPHIPTWAVFALGGLLVILAPAALALPRYTTSNYQYCLTCHGGGDTPNRGIESKVHPPFEQVGCTDCHAEPGQVVYEGYRQGFGSEPERVSPNCVSCHRDIARQNDQVGFKKN
ncbi:MAG: multiheme c-type cytochrome, partial [Chloroflexota bacterium]|nr:multiheme c-type cytochrome [Chloroflexota bacterium]